MKVALITSIPAFPTNAGNRARILQLAKAIQGFEHELIFIYLPLRKYDIDDLAHQKAFGFNNYIKLDNGGMLGDIVQYFRSRFPFIVKNILQLMGVRAFYYSSLDQNYNPLWTKEIKEKVGEVDIVFVEYVFNSLAFEAFPMQTKRIIDTHDAFGDRHKKYIAQGLKNGYWFSFKPKIENLGFRRANIILAIQEEEEIHFKKQLAEEVNVHQPKVEVVSHILDIDNPINDYSINDSAIFLGSNTPSNLKSINYFICEVLPLILASIPNFQLKLVGTICNDVQNHPNIEKIGIVNDLKEVFTKAPLSLNPMLVGTGINIKLLDAMAIGVATISTVTGVRGLSKEYQNGVVVISDNDPINYATEVIRFSKELKLRSEYGLAAYYDAKRWNAKQLNELKKCLSD